MSPATVDWNMRRNTRILLARFPFTYCLCLLSSSELMMESYALDKPRTEINVGVVFIAANTLSAACSTFIPAGNQYRDLSVFTVRSRLSTTAFSASLCTCERMVSGRELVGLYCSPFNLNRGTITPLSQLHGMILLKPTVYQSSVRSSEDFPALAFNIWSCMPSVHTALLISISLMALNMFSVC